MKNNKVRYLIEMIKDMQIDNKLRLAICMCDSSSTHLEYDKLEMYKYFDKLLKEIDVIYRNALINFAEYPYIMFAMAKIMENELESLIVPEKISNEEIKNLIYTIRGKQVMLDSDVARLYHCETKYVNRVVKRNENRFQEEFCFQLNENEFNSLRCKFVTLNENGRGQHRKYLPYAFTEQGIAMLSALLKSDIAVIVSVNIMKAFIEMRKFIYANGQVFERLTNMEYKLLEHDKKFDMVFDQLQHEENIKQKIFFEGQIYDAYSLIIDILKKANNKILIIDNYIDDSVLKMLSKKKKNVEVVILTSDKSNIQNIDIQKFNKEYPTLKVAKTNKFHDRFICLDNKEMYHLGASIKDLGKKCFGINRIEDIEIIEKIINFI